MLPQEELHCTPISSWLKKDLVRAFSGLVQYGLRRTEKMLISYVRRAAQNLCNPKENPKDRGPRRRPRRPPCHPRLHRPPRRPHHPRHLPHRLRHHPHRRPSRVPFQIPRGTQHTSCIKLCTENSVQVSAILYIEQNQMQLRN